MREPATEIHDATVLPPGATTSQAAREAMIAMSWGNGTPPMATTSIPPITPRPSRRRPRRSPALTGWGLETRVLLSAGPAIPGSWWPRRLLDGAAEVLARTRAADGPVPALNSPGPSIFPSTTGLSPPTVGALPATTGFRTVVGAGGGRHAGPFTRIAQLLAGQGMPTPVSPVVLTHSGPPAIASAATGFTGPIGGQSPPGGMSPPGPGPWIGSGGQLPWRKAGSTRQPGGYPTGAASADPVAMAWAVVDGQELMALVDPMRGQIILRYGRSAPSIFRDRSAGLNHPSGVALADLTGTGRIDLIVSNSGGNDVLIFPGEGGGRFGPELHGGAGLPVGKDPVGITVADVNGDGLPDLLVANKGSDTLSLLLGQSTGAGWALTPAADLPVGAGPVSTIVRDFSHDGHQDILVANSRSNNVYLLKGTGGGNFNVTAPTVVPVGSDPVQMLVGRFGPGLDPEVMTINKVSNDFTMISNIESQGRYTQTIPAGGLAPDAALAVDLNGTGVLDLVVANSGSGSFSLFKGGPSGLELASTFYDPNLPSPTALAPVAAGGGQVEFFASTAGQDTVDILAFASGAGAGAGTETGTDLTVVNSGQEVSLTLDSPLAATSGDAVIAQLIPLRGSSLDSIALLVTATRGDRPTQPDLDEAAGGPLLLELATSPVGQASAAAGPAAAAIDPEAAPADAAIPATPSARSPRSWTRFVIGVDEALDGTGRAPLDPDPVPAPGDAEPIRVVSDDTRVAAVDAAIRELCEDEVDLEAPDGPAQGTGPAPAAPPAVEDPAEVAATASAATLLAARLILKVSPRHAYARRRFAWARRPTAGGRHDREGRDSAGPSRQFSDVQA